MTVKTTVLLADNTHRNGTYRIMCKVSITIITVKPVNGKIKEEKPTWG